MNPIHEHGNKSGIGYTMATFLNRFDEICVEHQHSGRAKSFAIIFYSQSDRQLMGILRDRDLFVQLDRLSGKQVSIFYLEPGRDVDVQLFNAEFVRKLEISENIEMPCIVFFKLRDGMIADVFCVLVDSRRRMLVFNELYLIIQRYLSGSLGAKGISNRYRYFKSAATFFALETFRAVIASGVGKLF